MDQLNTIEKSRKDRTLLENWRPISLVNVDTKIVSKVIAARVKKVLPSIIHYNQTGYVKDRFIGEAIRSIFDIMDFTAKENIPGLLLFIAELWRAKRACGAPWVSKSTHPRKFGNHVTVHRPQPARPSVRTTGKPMFNSTLSS